jgi:hypothetical protein
MAVFWDAAPCILAEIDGRFRSAYCPHYQAALGKFLREYTAQHPKKTVQLFARRQKNKKFNLNLLFIFKKNTMCPQIIG